jgi:hypothetical protein
VHLYEVRQEINPAPAWITELDPGIKVARVTSVPEKSVEDGAATKSFALRKPSRCVVEVGLIYGGDAPVVLTDKLCADEDGHYDAFLTVVAVRTILVR